MLRSLAISALPLLLGFHEDPATIAGRHAGMPARSVCVRFMRRGWQEKCLALGRSKRAGRDPQRGMRCDTFVCDMPPLDTTAAASAVQEAIQRRLLGPGGRFAVALELSNLVRSFARAGMRQRHPERSDAENAAELAHAIGPAATRLES